MPISDRPRLLQLCAVDFTAQHFLLPLMRAQRAWGFEVEFACAPGDYAAAIVNEGFGFQPVAVERSLNPVAHLRAYRQLGQILRLRRYAAVHVHTPIAALIGRPAARRCGVPVVVYTAHGFYFHDRMKPRQRRLHVGLERWAQRYADFLMTQSAEDAETAVREGISDRERTLAIGNGVDLTRFRPDRLSDRERTDLRAEIGLQPTDGPVVMMMGRLVREKGYFEFLDAWAQVRGEFPRARALLVGQALSSEHDRAAEEILVRIEALGLRDSVFALGHRSDVAQLMALTDLFALPSWREGMPRSIVEAMAAGLPVIATDIRGCREEVIDGETGRLVPVNDAEALADALRDLLSNADLRKRMGAAGRRRAEAEYDERKVIARQERVFRRLFAEKRLAWPR